MSQIDIANQVLIFIVFAVSLNLLMGYAGQASIAHAAFGAVGGYTAALLSIHEHWPFLAAAAAAIGMGWVVGILVSLPALSLGGEYLILLTIAVAYIVIAIVQGENSLGGQYGLQGIHHISVAGFTLTSPEEIFPLFLGMGVLVVGACWRIGESPYGRVLKAIREDEAAARSLGKSTVRAKVVVFGLTSALAGLAGAMFVFYYSQISPTQWGVQEAVAMIAMVVIGGSGNLFGAVIGGIIVQASTPFLEDVVKINPDSASFVQLSLYGAALVVLMIFRPGGILPERIGRRGSTRAGRPGLGLIRPGALAPATTSLKADTAAPAGLGSMASVARGTAGPMSGADPAAPSHAEAGTGESDHAVVVRDLWKSFGGIAAVNGVDLALRRGAITALIGPNGAGKSTVFALLTGFLRADRGRVELNGQAITGAPPNVIAKMGMVRSFQDVRLFRQMTVLDNVMLGVQGQSGEKILNLFFRPLRVRRDERAVRLKAQEYLAQVGLQDKGTWRAAELGHGEQKLAAIGRVLATEAEVLLLDEPTSGIDPSWVESVAQAIRILPDLGRTVCVVEHNLSFIGRLDADCYFLETGKVAATGGLEQLMGNDDLRNLYFGTKGNASSAVSRASIAARSRLARHAGEERG